MSKIALTPNGSGSGVFTIASPNSNTNRTITLPDESITLGAGTPSIDDNGNATAITIDSSENVGIGATSPSSKLTVLNGTANTQVASFSGADSGGGLKILTASTTRSDDTVILKASDAFGEIAFTSDNTEVMRITKDNNVGIGTSSPTAKFSVAGSTSGDYLAKIESTNQFGLKIKTTSTSNSHEQLAIHDGNNDVKFKVMGGGNVYATAINLGGTAAANKLDDYEEGTFTPVVAGGSSAGTASYFTQSGSYTKVGNLVTVWIRLNYTGGNGSGSLQVKGFPFTVVTTNIPTFVVYTVGITAPSTTFPAGFCNLSDGIQLVQNQTGGNSGPTLAYDGSGEIVITGTYPTNA